MPPQLDEPPPAAPRRTDWPPLLRTRRPRHHEAQARHALVDAAHLRRRAGRVGRPDARLARAAAPRRSRSVPRPPRLPADGEPVDAAGAHARGAATRTAAHRPAVHCLVVLDRARRRGAGGAPQPAQGPRRPARRVADLGGHLRLDFRRLAAEREPRDRRRTSSSGASSSRSDGRSSAPARVWLLYLALEPYVRKFWPTTLISWSRCVAGNVLDPQVGRDVLIGVSVAAIVLLVGRLEDARSPDARLSDGPDRRAEPRHAAGHPRNTRPDRPDDLQRSLQLGAGSCSGSSR